MKIAVIGSGVMGSGIAQLLAKKHNVIIRDISAAALEKAVLAIKGNLGRAVAKEKITQEDMDSTMSRITTSLDIQDIKDCDMVIEAATEDERIKLAIFEELDKVCDAKTILATNTSSLSITAIGAVTKRPDKVIGMHFFNPVPVMKLVEVIKGQLTSDETEKFIMDLSYEVGQSPVEVEEGAGFVVNRLLIPMINEAIGIYAERLTTAEYIDKAMKLGANHPMGPLALGDLIGWDVCLAIMEVLYDELGDTKYRPHPYMKKLVRSKQLGRKTGKGIYTYNN